MRVRPTLCGVRGSEWTNSNVGCAGGPVDARDRQIRFRLSEPVLDGPGQERVPGAWLSHESPETSVMMQILSVGPFVRALLVVRLVGGYAVTDGVWVGIHPGDLQRAFRVWWEPEYENLRLEGALTNSSLHGACRQPPGSPPSPWQ